MERRKFMLGIGSLAAGGAAAMGTGAFTTVKANRDITVKAAGDASAFLQIKKAEENGDVTPNADEYVETNDDGVVSMDFSSTEAGGSGVNYDATTIFDNLIDITNQGSQKINVGVDLSTEPEVLGIYAEGEQGNSEDNTGFAVRNYDDSSAEAQWENELEPGGTLENIGVYISDPSAIDGEETYTITIVAERVGGNRD